MLRRHALAALLAVACLFLASCVTAHVLTLVRYEAKDDSFRCLQAFINIRSADKGDLDHMKAMYERRASILISPVQVVVFENIALDRLEKHKGRWVSLGKPPEVGKEPAVFTTLADLDSIQSIPGEFHLNSHGHLCYYQEVVIPGKAVDAILKDLAPHLAQMLAEQAKKQAELAGDPKARKLTWDALRKEILRDLAAKDPKDQAGAEPNKEEGEAYLDLEPASLNMLRNAGAARSLALSRNKEIFTIVVPLSPKDAQEAANTIQQIQAAVAARVKAGKQVEDGLAQALPAIQAKAAPGGLELAVDLAKALTSKTVDLAPMPEADKQAEYQSTVTAMQDRGVPVNAKPTGLKELVAKYVGGK